MFGKRKEKSLEKEYGKFLDQYEELFEESDCRACDKYFDGNVENHIDRFKDCFDCTKDCEVLKNLARKMDDVISQIDSL